MYRPTFVSEPMSNPKSKRKAAGAATLLRQLSRKPYVWLLAALPALLATKLLAVQSQTLTFFISALAIIGLAALLSSVTESVASKVGGLAGGLINATMGNTTELIVALIALQAGQFGFVKATIVGAIVTKVLFTMGMAFFLGGLKYHLQEYNRRAARLQASLVFLAVIVLFVPSALSDLRPATPVAVIQTLSLSLSILLLATYGLAMLFSFRTHRELFHSANQEIVEDVQWPMGLALPMLGAVALLLAVVSHIFVNSVEHAAKTFDMTPAFVGFVIVALMSGVPEMVSGWSAARKNQLDLSIGIALGGATQLALFVAPLLVLCSYFVGPAPMTLQFWPAAVAMVLVAGIIAWMATNSGISAWFVGAFLVMVYGVFAMSLYVLPPE